MSAAAQIPPAAGPGAAGIPVRVNPSKSHPVPFGTVPGVEDQGGLFIPAVGAGEEQRQIVNRLRRAHDQLGGVIAAVHSGADCMALVPGLSAVRVALDKAGFSIISTAMRDCLTGAPEEKTARPGASSLEEIRKLFLTLT